MQLRVTWFLAAALFGLRIACAQTTPADPPAAGAVPPAPVAPSAGTPPPSAASGGQPVPATRWTPQQIRQSFDRADANGDGQLTRAEAQRLSILPHGFEDMDRNKDGVVTRAEYEASFNAQ